MICCSIFSDVSAYLLVFLINIGFLTKSGNNDSSFAISLVLALSLSLSYSLDFIFSSNCLLDRFFIMHSLPY